MGTDGLTGLLRWDEIAAHISEGACPFAAFFDIDELAWLSACVGREASDRALIDVSRTLEGLALPLQGRVFRVGGDEFMVLLPLACHGDAVVFAKRAIRAVAELKIEYARADDPARKHVAINAIVARIDRNLGERIREVREWIANTIFDAKSRDRHRVEVLADLGERLWSAPAT